jgi:O6-methylguanine-DNA--protein-cysteine methyltransferase
VSHVDDEYVEAVLARVERVPAGRVTTYGAVARAAGSGDPRQVWSAACWPCMATRCRGGAWHSTEVS